MKSLAILSSIVCFMLMSFSAMAQSDLVFVKSDNVFVSKGETTDNPDKTPDYYRHHQPLHGYFSGHAIELTSSDFPLGRDYQLFEKFGNVKVHKLPTGGFSYLITGFKNEEAARKHLTNIVIHQAPEGKVIYYVKGRRKN